MLRMPGGEILRCTALSAPSSTSTSISLAPRPPPKKNLCRRYRFANPVKSCPSRWHHLNSRSRVSRPFYFRVVTHGNISAPPEFQLYFKKSDCAQSRFSRKTRRASYPVRPWADHPAPPMPVAPHERLLLAEAVSLHPAMRRSWHPTSSTAAVNP